jgi:hypothetical protein
MRALTKVCAVVAVGVLAAACSSSGKPSPQHSFGSLTGKSTTLTLAPTFVQSLAKLGAAPTPIGKAQVAIPKLTFPITGGHLDIYKSGDATPPVQGVVDHRGSGLELTVGQGKKKSAIDLKNLVIDLGAKTMSGDVTRNGTVLFRDADLFTLDTSKMAPPTVTASGVTLSGIKVELSSDAAVALKQVFNMKNSPIKGGLLVGVATIDATGSS